MEYSGRITRVLELKTGTSKRTGNEWKSLPFIFEYKEHETDRETDSVLLETMDTNEMNAIGKHLAKDESGKAIVENGEMRLTSEIRATCGWYIRAMQGTKGLFNQVRKYKLAIEGMSQQSAPAPAQAEPKQIPVTTEATQAPQAMVQNTDDEDGLPF